MRSRSILAVAALSVLAAAPPVLAWGGGGRGHGGHAVSGSFEGGTFQGTCQGSVCSGTVTDANGSTRRVTGTFTVASEPLTALVVGLGLLGARYLRRR